MSQLLKNKKIILIGVDGQLAFDIKRVFEPDYKIIGLTKKDLDITDGKKVREIIIRDKPDLVINTAAYHKVEECDLNPEKTFLVNALGAYYVAKATKEINAAVMFFSTDYVFDGNKKYYTEKDEPNPINIYGASKLAGEILVKIANPKNYIIRTTGLFGVHQSGKGHNFVLLMLKLAKGGKEMRVVNDQFCSPTYTLDLARKLKELIDKNADFGTYHITNQNSCSWHQFAKEILKSAGYRDNIKAIKSEDQHSNIRRPKRSILKSTNLKKNKTNLLRPWPKALGDYIKELRKYKII